MLKKISVDQLVVGMYVQELVGTWLDNPFWRASFVITEVADLALIRASRISEVWIDTAKGLDVAALAEVVVEVAPTPPVEVPVLDHAQLLQPDIAAQPVPIADELARAAQICAQSRQAVSDMFREARMGKAVDAQRVGELVQDISDSVARNASALISLARLKTVDDYTYMHSVAVCAMMIALARQLGFDGEAVRAAGVAGLLHDMGKALLPPGVLSKPGKLTAAEFAIVRSHPELGHRILVSGGNASPISLDVCLHHHEKMDGTGYPEGIKGRQISLHARMGAICDVYDAITSNRPYKAGWDPAESMRKMGEWAGGHFDQVVFQAFVKSLGIYPVGSLVRLSTGRLGVVTAQTAGSLTTPMVKAFYSIAHQERIPAQEIDLSQPGCTEKIVAREDPAKWQFEDLDAMWSAPPAT